MTVKKVLSIIRFLDLNRLVNALENNEEYNSTGNECKREGHFLKILFVDGSFFFAAQIDEELFQFFPENNCNNYIGNGH